MFYHYVKSSTNVEAGNEAGIGGSDTLVKWCRFVRQKCLVFSERVSQKKIGGPGLMVEVDEAYFLPKKGNRGRGMDMDMWVLAGIEREDTLPSASPNTRSVSVFFTTVKERTKETLVDIKEHVEPGSKIYSDCFASYECLNDLELENGDVLGEDHPLPRELPQYKYRYHHHAVNHDITFVHYLDSSIHTQRLHKFFHNKYSRFYVVLLTYQWWFCTSFWYDSFDSNP